MTDQKQCAKLKNIKCFLFDMDGTINLGNTLITGMDVFFQKLRAAERDFYLVTNNSSKGHEHYVEKMGRMGIQVTRDNVLISSDAFVYYMQQLRPAARLFVLGTEQLKNTIREAGFTITTTLEEGTDFVVVGFDMSGKTPAIPHPEVGGRPTLPAARNTEPQQPCTGDQSKFFS